jgi:hypothetical protein
MRPMGNLRFIAIFNKFLRDTDRFRVWARGCACHQEQLAKHVKVDCELKGRRLKEAPVRVQEYQMVLSDTARDLKLSDCEDDQALFLEYGSALRLAFAEAGERFGWVSEPPYIFANILDRDWARVWVDHVSSVEEALQHRLVIPLNARFGPEIARIADGHTTYSEAIVEESRVWGRMPLVSDKAEGYHRSVKQEHDRAPAAKLPFIFATMRLEQNLELANLWCETAEGRDTFRSNWVNFFRVLQTKSARFLKRKRGGTRAFKLKQLYKVDEFARVDWSFAGSC